MKAILTILAGIIVSATAHANLTGTWKGTGEVRDGNGFSQKCQKMTLKMGVTKTKLSVAYNYQCGSGSIYTEQPLVADIKNGAIVYGGIKLGTVSATAMNIAYTTADGMKFSYKVKVDKKGKMTYAQHADVDADNFLKIAGIFKK